MAELIEFRCPHCNQLYRLDAQQLARHAGRTSTCRKCGQAFTFPSLPTEQTPVEPSTVPTLPPPSIEQTPPPLAQAPAEPVPTEPAAATPPEEADVPGLASLTAAASSVPPMRRRPPGQSPVNLNSILSFRTLLGVPLVRAVFWILVALCLIQGVMSIVMSFSGPPRVEIEGLTVRETPSFHGWLFFLGLVEILIGPVFVRLGCELCVAVFRINGSLTEIRHELADRKKAA